MTKEEADVLTMPEAQHGYGFDPGPLDGHPTFWGKDEAEALERLRGSYARCCSLQDWYGAGFWMRWVHHVEMLLKKKFCLTRGASHNISALSPKKGEGRDDRRP